MIETNLIDALLGADDILCVSHVGPDGDAVGSLLGMGWLLRRLDKRPTLALEDDVPAELCYLPGAGAIITAVQEEFATRVVNRPFDIIVCLDASSPDRMGVVYNEVVHRQSRLIVIDHHITNTYFGDINWVAPQTAATCQMLVQLADALGVSLTGELAECLLTGVITDTLCFRTSNTDAAVLATAMRLVQGGANLASIVERSLNRRPFSSIKLWGMVLPNVHLEQGVIWATVTRAQLQAAGHDDADAKLSSLLVTVDEADVSAVFTEKVDANGQLAIECSFRAKPGFNVSDLAFQLGGGGHPPASGCTLTGSLDEATARVVPALVEARRRQANHGADPIRGHSA